MPVRFVWTLTRSHANTLTSCSAIATAQAELKQHQRDNRQGQAWNLTAAELTQAAKTHSEVGKALGLLQLHM